MKPSSSSAYRQSPDSGYSARQGRTTAWPLALAYSCLIIYASLFSFSDWRDQGLSPFAFLLAPLPKYWTWFDIVANVLGYAPLGLLLALSALRRWPTPWALALALLGATTLSLCMETLQSYLPTRIPSNLDLTLNAAGAGLGVSLAWLLKRAGVLDRWRSFRARWFTRDARGALVLLLLWPVALLFPATVPLGLGHVFERLESALVEALEDTPFLDWLPVREVELQPLSSGTALVCVAMGALIPCWLGYSVIRSPWHRAGFALTTLAVGLVATALSAALSYGPEHVWAWLDVTVRLGLALAFVLAAATLALPLRGAAAFALLALAIHLSLLNQTALSTYFAQTLQTWEQGRFIRFHGVVQWLGWLWPYASLAYLLVRISERDALHTTPVRNG